MAPRDLALSRPSPRGKKNFRGAPRLRQIDRGNLSLTQVRPDVTGCARMVAAWPARKRTAKTRPANAGVPAADNGGHATPAKASDGSFMSFEGHRRGSCGGS